MMTCRGGRTYETKPVPPSPSPSSEGVSRAMRSNQAGTKPELLVAKLLRKKLVASSLPGRPDFVYPKSRLAIFVHGCFWHRCQVCDLPLPKTHTEFWRRKFERNVERDMLNRRDLRATGWRVLEVWEHELRRNPKAVAEKIRNEALVNGNKGPLI